MTGGVLQVLGRSAGGIARHVAEITSALDGLDGLEIEIAGPVDLPIPMPKPVIEVTIPNGPLGHRRARRTLKAVIDERRPRVVHAHGLRAGIDASLAAKDSEAEVIVTIHNLVQPEVAGRLKALIYKPAERIVVRVADRILAVSRDIADELRRRVPEDRRMDIEVLHLGVPQAAPPGRSEAKVRDELGVGPGRRLVVTASRLSAQKALHVMLDAMTSVDAFLAVAGEGPLESELRERAQRLGIDDRVAFLGFRTDVADLIAAADVFCLSSVWEGVPLAAMEAVRLGTPVVATDVGGTGELIADGVSGRLVPADDPAALAAALDAVLGDEEERAAFARAARETLASDFSTEKMLSRLRELYSGSGR